jgi:shikimate kinase
MWGDCPGEDTNVPERTIALVGLSGAGKSTVGVALAHRLGRPLVDIDALVVAAAGRSIADLFAAEGEAAFREREAAALAAALAGPACVLATGGGIVLRPANRALLTTQAFVVWLDAPDTVILDRLAAHAERRPLLEADPAARLAALRRDRSALYAAVAQLTIDTTALSPQAVVERIIGEMRT